MKCFSLSTFGVIVGILHIFIHAGAVIVSTVLLVSLDETNRDHSEDKDHSDDQKEAFDFSKTILILILVFSLLLQGLGGLLIAGIVKKRHKLMLPWLIYACFCYSYNIGYNFSTLISGISSGAPPKFVISFVIHFIACFTIGGYILYGMIKLYKSIRRENIEKPGLVKFASKMGYQRENI